ncbi:MAG: LicD family protein [Gammaproteobacteria bacterium]|nr:LicD family protein [Gammaproteobacteria bacterium]
MMARFMNWEIIKMLQPKYRRHRRQERKKLMYQILCDNYSRAIKQHGFEALAKIHELCVANNISYWLYAGTLLGMIRDKGFIYSDTDIDIGVWDDDDIRNDLEKYLSANGYVKIHEYTVDGHIREQRFEYKGVGIDFYYFRKNEEYSYASSFNKKERQLYLVKGVYDLNAFDKLVNINIKGTTLSIPENYIHVLEKAYGDWKTPVTKADGYIMFGNPNKLHCYDVKAECIHHADSIHK